MHVNGTWDHQPRPLSVFDVSVARSVGHVDEIGFDKRGQLDLYFQRKLKSIRETFEMATIFL